MDITASRSRCEGELFFLISNQNFTEEGLTKINFIEYSSMISSPKSKKFKNSLKKQGYLNMIKICTHYITSLATILLFLLHFEKYQIGNNINFYHSPATISTIQHYLAYVFAQIILFRNSRGEQCNVICLYNVN